MDFTTYQGISIGAAQGHSASGGLVDLLLEQVKSRPQAEVAVCAEGRVSYQQLFGRARAIACQLVELGITRGDKIGLLFPNGPQFIASFFAASGLGATVVPINPLLKSEEIAHILRDSEAKCLVVHERAIDEVLQSVDAVPSLRHVVVFGKDSSLPPRKSTVEFIALTALDDAPSVVAWPVAVDPDKDLSVLVYTSGTTGKPKGAMLTHASLFFTIGTATRAFKFGPSDRFLAVLPLCHIYGLTVVMLGIISCGGALVILEKFEAPLALETIAREKVTILPAVPTMYQFMLLELERSSFDLSSVRMCISGAASLPVEIFAKIEEKFGAPLIEGYGLTEVSCLATFNRPDGVRKVGSVGYPIDNVVVSIVDDEGRHLSCGRENVGEIAIKGPNVMVGYYKQPEATAEAIRRGWFLTGDLAYRDGDGYIFIVGRKKELIIRGGQNIYPREIEEVLSRMQTIVEAAVVGVPDRYMGERVKAVVVKRPGVSLSEDEVKEFCLSHLAEYKVPRLVEFVDALPRNSTGKILKRLLVETQNA